MKTNIYLNFAGQTEEAFLFYKSVFGGEFIKSGPDGHDMARMGDAPSAPGQAALTEDQKNLIMHVALEVGSLTLMGTDATADMGFDLKIGNNVYISLHPETRAEADELFTKLSVGGVVETELSEAFWGAYYGTVKDKYGVQWMFNVDN